MHFKGFFHILFQHARRGRDSWDQYLFTVTSPIVLTAGLFALDGPSLIRGVVSLALVAVFVFTLPNTNPELQALRAGTPLQRAHAQVITQHIYGWRGRPKLLLFLATYVLWVIGFAACMVQPVVDRLS